MQTDTPYTERSTHRHLMPRESETPDKYRSENGGKVKRRMAIKEMVRFGIP